MSDTPRTDEFICRAVRTDHNWRTFARQLERELAAANSKLSTVFQWINRNHPDGFIDSQSHLQTLERVPDLPHDRLDAAQRAQAKWQALAGLLAAPLKATVWRSGLGNASFRHLTEENAETALSALAAYEAAKKACRQP